MPSAPPSSRGLIPPNGAMAHRTGRVSARAGKRVMIDSAHRGGRARARPFGIMILVADVLDVIRELAESGMTMLIATHEMGFARDIASRVCFLADGEVVEQAPPDRLFSEPSDERTRRFLRRIVDAGRM